MESKDYLFTSESVTEGHPDKIADQISDAVLDAILADDPYGRVACETMVKTGYAIVAGEITTKATLDYPKIIRKAIVDIGYTDGSHGIDGNSCAILTAIEQQSPDIAQGVDVETSLSKDQGAGESQAEKEQAETEGESSLTGGDDAEGEDPLGGASSLVIMRKGPDATSTRSSGFCVRTALSPACAGMRRGRGSRPCWRRWPHAWSG